MDLAIMKSAHGVPVNQAASKAFLVIGLVPCRSYLSCHERVVTTQPQVRQIVQQWVSVSLSSQCHRYIIAIKVAGVLPHGPGDANHLVGQADHGAVVSHARLEF
jgi:hypothetical protein